MYRIVGVEYLPSIKAVGNGFAKETFVRAVKGAKELTVFGIADEMVDERLFVDIGGITKDGVSVKEAVSRLRWDMLGFSQSKEISSSFVEENADLLFLDYLLASSLCYIEAREDCGKTDRFLGTRNRFIAGELAGKSEQETLKYKSYLSSVVSDYRNKQIRVLRMSKGKGGYKISKPRENLDFYNKQIRVFPVYLMDAFVKGYMGVLKDQVLRFRQISESGAVGELVTTLSASVLSERFGTSMTGDMLRAVEYIDSEGVWYLPDLEGSRYGKGVKALSPARVLSVEEVSEINKSFTDVDLDEVVLVFLMSLESMGADVLETVYKDLVGNRGSAESEREMRRSLEMHIQLQNDFLGEGYRKALHKYMVENAEIFKGYTGKRDETEFGLGSFEDLG